MESIGVASKREKLFLKDKNHRCRLDGDIPSRSGGKNGFDRFLRGWGERIEGLRFLGGELEILVYFKGRVRYLLEVEPLTPSSRAEGESQCAFTDGVDALGPVGTAIPKIITRLAVLERLPS